MLQHGRHERKVRQASIRKDQCRVIPRTQSAWNPYIHRDRKQDGDREGWTKGEMGLSFSLGG